MHSNRRLLIALPLLALGIVLLRQAIVIATGELPVLERHVEIMQEQDIEPAALFYTDSRVALRAIQHVDQRVNDQ